MARIKLDDLVKYRDIVGIVSFISVKGFCTVAELKDRNKVHRFPIEELELLARKGTRRYSMTVEGSLPTSVGKPARPKNEKSPLDALQDAYADAKFSHVDGSDSIDLDLSEEEIMERIDLSLDLKDVEMFKRYTELLKK